MRPGAMNRLRKMTRAVSLVIVVIGPSLLPACAQVTRVAQESVSQIQKEISRHPDNSKLYVRLGLAFWDRNDYAHAFEAFERAVKFGPSSAEAHNWLGAAFMQKGDFPDAVAEFRKAISHNPQYARGYNNLGSALAKNGDLSGAIGAFRKALWLE